MKNIDISFIFPCLNEEHTINLCIDELEKTLKSMPINYEIIISDNGSTDKSLEIAKKRDVVIINTPKKGYGEALKNGFANAKGKYIAFADIDGSYPLEFLPKMYEKIVKSDADMVVASRMTGKIEKHAMPFLHRYVGTPILTKLINLLFKGKLSDCNSGFRLMKKSSYLSWGVSSEGMEFASELLIKALKNKAKIEEIPAGLRVDKRNKAPHLNTWRDGMRHLLFILSECPKLFEISGLLLSIVSSLLFLFAIFFAPVKIGKISLLNYHSQMILIIVATLGIQVWVFSLILYLLKDQDKPYKISQQLINIKEEKLLLVILLIFITIASGIIYIFNTWAKASFEDIDMLYSLLKYIFLVSVLGSGTFGLLGIHILKKSMKIKK